MNKKSIILVVALSALAGALYLFIEQRADSPTIVKLWDGEPPSSNGLSGDETRGGWLSGNKWIGNISEPDIRIYSPSAENNKGVAVLICPGGGYAGLAIKHEGSDLARWLNDKGVTGIVLKYRMPNMRREIPLDDVRQAMKYIHDHRTELGLDAEKIGIAGFSAGGHLAARTSVKLEADIRPRFTILFYPVVSMKDSLTHLGSRIVLLGRDVNSDEIREYSNEEQVDTHTPPAILLLSEDDTDVLPANSIAYYEALKKNNIPAEIHIYPQGGHGWGMGRRFKYHKEMLVHLNKWLSKNILDEK